MSPMNVTQGNLTSSSSYMLDLNLEANTVYLSRPLDVEYKKIETNDPNYVSKEETTIVRPSEQLEIAPESGKSVILELNMYYKITITND